MFNDPPYPSYDPTNTKRYKTRARSVFQWYRTHEQETKILTPRTKLTSCVYEIEVEKVKITSEKAFAFPLERCWPNVGDAGSIAGDIPKTHLNRFFE